MKGHNFDHGCGDICKKCGKIHVNPMKRPDVVKKHRDWWDSPAGVIRRKLLSVRWTMNNPMFDPEIAKKVNQNPMRNLKIGEAIKRRWQLPGFRESMSKLHSLLTTELWRDPVYHRSHVEGIRRFNSKPESTDIRRRAALKANLKNTPEKRRETTLKNWADPEKRKNILDGMATIDQEESKRMAWEERRKLYGSTGVRDPEQHRMNWARSIKLRPNQPEKRIIKICEEYNIPFKYTGDKPYPSLGGKMPDFVYEESKKILEHCGNHWHNEVETNDRINYFELLGYDTLILWEHEMTTSSDEEIARRVIEFLGHHLSFPVEEVNQ